MRSAPITFFFPVVALLFTTTAATAVSIGQVDDFEDLTTQDWVIGIDDGSPQAIGSGGPGGSNDAFLQHESTGGRGVRSRMVLYNTSQWAGDYLAEGITGLSADVINLGPTTLELRLAFGDNRSARIGDWFASTEGVSLAPGSGWQSVFLPIDEGSLTQVLGTGSYAELMVDVGALRVLSSVDPSNIGDVIGGTIGIDNLRAVPEPTSLVLAVFASLAGGRRRH